MDGQRRKSEVCKAKITHTRSRKFGTRLWLTCGGAATAAHTHTRIHTFYNVSSSSTASPFPPPPSLASRANRPAHYIFSASSGRIPTREGTRQQQCPTHQLHPTTANRSKIEPPNSTPSSTRSPLAPPNPLARNRNSYPTPTQKENSREEPKLSGKISLQQLPSCNVLHSVRVPTPPPLFFPSSH